MRSLFDEEDQEEPKSDADLTLGIGSLLSIFFGVVLICGIFFGFGYSMGRRNARATAASATAATQSQETASASSLPDGALTTAPLKPQSPDGEPDNDNAGPDEKQPADATANHPAAASHPVQPAPKETTAPPAASRPARVVEPATPTPSLSAVPFAHRAPLPSKPHAGISAPLEQAQGDAEIQPGQSIMVQIAAISRQEDAEVLAGALRKRGFSPSVRPGTTDKLFHVQVGPFTDKTQAETIKQHLLADGYNAIMK